jgi:hypothetical protein
VGQKEHWKQDHPYDLRMRIKRYIGRDPCDLTREIGRDQVWE